MSTHEFQRSVVIDRSADTVWGVLVDFETYGPSWLRGLETVTRLGSKPVQLGTRFYETRTEYGRTGEGEFEVVAFEEGVHIAVSSRQGPIRATYAYSVTDDGAGSTQVDLRARTEFGGMARFVGPLAGRLVERHDSDMLERLRTTVEAV